MRIIPFESADDVRSIEVRVAPIDAGTDLRRQSIAVQVLPGTTRASYEHDGKHLVVEGTREDVVSTLRSAGYTVAD